MARKAKTKSSYKKSAKSIKEGRPTPSEALEATLPIGAPSKYESKFCTLLIEHNKKGFSFESFAALARVSKSTLYKWTEEFSEFMDAKLEGHGLLRLYWEKVGISGITGMIRRIKKEEVVVNSDGTERVLTREYEYGGFNSAGWKLVMANLFGWKHHVTITEGEKAPNAMTNEQKNRFLAKPENIELIEKLAKATSDVIQPEPKDVSG